MMPQSLKDIDYALARILLTAVVNKEGKLTYKEVAEKLTTVLGRKIHAHFNLASPLGNVSTLCHSLGLPLLSATVIRSGVTSANIIGEGFYPLACSLKPEYKQLTPLESWKKELALIRTCTEWDKLDKYLSHMDGNEPIIPNSNPEKTSPIIGSDAFSLWMSKNTNLSPNSIYKYSHAVETVSKEMLVSGVIALPLGETDPLSLDVAIQTILSNNQFVAKNKKGNNMYSNALKQFRYFKHSSTAVSDESIDYDSFIGTTTTGKTERESIVLSRIGQGQFRQSLMQKYSSRCIITGIDHPSLLVASHIKPWAASTNEERLSVDNGLLLCATYDRLFDNGLITFEKSGRIFLSSFISEENKLRLGLKSGMCFTIKATEKTSHFLQYHSDVLFIR